MTTNPYIKSADSFANNSSDYFPRLDQSYLSQIQTQIKSRQEMIQSGKKYRRELFGLMRQEENLSFRERFDEVKAIIQDYEKFLLWINKHQDNYQIFSLKLIQNIQQNLSTEFTILLQKENKRQEMEQRFQTDHLVSALKNKGKLELLTFMFGLGRISLLLLQKLELLTNCIKKLIFVVQSQKNLVLQIKQQFNEYNEFYQFQKELIQGKDQATEEFKNVVNFEQNLSPILINLESLTNQFINVYSQLEAIIKEVEALEDNFLTLDSDQLFYLKADPISAQLIKLLIPSPNSQQKLILALQKSPTQEITLDGFSLFDDFFVLHQTIKSFQASIDNYFEKYREFFSKLNCQIIVVNSQDNNNNHHSKSIDPSPHNAPDSAKIKLVSTQGVDYQKLQQLLKDNKWKEADYETYKLMLIVLKKKEGDHIYQQDLKIFSCEDFTLIDQLWSEYSQGRFGFTKQREIWFDCGGKSGVYDDKIAQLFGDRIGWKRRNSWLNYNDLIFNLNAPFGHLPLIRVQYGGKSILFSRKIIHLIASKLEECERQ